MLRAALIIAAIVASFAMIAWASTVSPSYEECEADHAKHYTDPEKSHAKEELRRGLIEGAMVFALCEGEFIHKNEGVIIAIFTVLLVISTTLLWDATRKLQRDTGRLYEAGERQFKLAEKQFNATHRPRLRLRDFRVIAGDGDRQRKIQFTIASIGAGTATMIGSCGKAEFFVRDSLPPPNFTGGQDVLIAPRRFMPGATDEQATIQLRYDNQTINSQQGAQTPLHAYGYVVYRDELGNTFSTHFCRAYDLSSDRFRAVVDPDYEYED